MIQRLPLKSCGTSGIKRLLLCWMPSQYLNQCWPINHMPTGEQWSFKINMHEFKDMGGVSLRILALQIKICWCCHLNIFLSDHHEILHMLRQQCCRCMCKILWCSDSYIWSYGWTKFDEEFWRAVVKHFPECFVQTRSIPCLLMPWLQGLPGHLQAEYWQCRIGKLLWEWVSTTCDTTLAPLARASLWTLHWVSAKEMAGHKQCNGDMIFMLWGGGGR